MRALKGGKNVPKHQWRCEVPPHSVVPPPLHSGALPPLQRAMDGCSRGMTRRLGFSSMLSGLALQMILAASCAALYVSRRGAVAASWRLAASACAALLQQMLRLGLAAHIGGFAC